MLLREAKWPAQAHVVNDLWNKASGSFSKSKNQVIVILVTEATQRQILYLGRSNRDSVKARQPLRTLASDF